MLLGLSMVQRVDRLDFGRQIVKARELVWASDNESDDALVPATTVMHM